MDSILSVFFNIDRTYIGIVTPSLKGLSLNYINSTDHRIDLENFDDYESEQGTEELKKMIRPLRKKISKITVTIPAEFVLVSQFPGKSGMVHDDLRKLIALEIRQAFPQFNPDDFGSNLIPMETKDPTKSMMMAVIIPQNILQNCLTVLKSLKLPISNVEISQLNAHSAFLYNYPESADKTVMIMGLQDQFIDLSVIKEGKPAYYNLVSFSDKNKIGDIFKEEYNKLLKDTVDSIDAVYLFGTGLTKEVYAMAWETIMDQGIEVGRLNAFRMVESTLTEREKEYCARTMHLFPPVIGGSFPAYHEQIKLY